MFTPHKFSTFLALHLYLNAFFCLLYQHELEKAKVSEKTQSSRGVSSEGNTARLVTENEKLLKDLKKVH